MSSSDFTKERILLKKGFSKKRFSKKNFQKRILPRKDFNMKKFLKILLLIIALILVIVLGYVAYVFLDYERIDDNVSIEPTGQYKHETLNTSKTHSIMSYNIGYGAYSSDYTFFMDGGIESKGGSADEVMGNVVGAIEVVKDANPDIVFFQEVDIKADRSYDIDQSEVINQNFPDYQMMEAVNYNSSYLFYPVTDPIGASLSEVATLSKYKMNDGIRRSLPISTGFSKFFDLDRCYTVQTVELDNGKKLFLYNVHLSAYGADASVRDGQMQMLFDDMKSNYTDGNYVIVGGDFNHDFTGTSGNDFNEGKDVNFEWAQPFPEEFLGEQFTRATNYDSNNNLPTGRVNDIPYDPTKSTVLILDGFIVSDNIDIIKVGTVDTQFEYSDHMPVHMEFKFK